MDPYEALDMFQKLSNPQFHLLLKKKKRRKDKRLYHSVSYRDLEMRQVSVILLTPRRCLISAFLFPY